MYFIDNITDFTHRLGSLESSIPMANIFAIGLAFCLILPLSYQLNSSFSLQSDLRLSENLYDGIYSNAKYSAITYCSNDGKINCGELKYACPDKLCSDSVGLQHLKKSYVGTVSGIIVQNFEEKQFILALKGTTTNKERIIDFKFHLQPYAPINEKSKAWKKWFQKNPKCSGCTVHGGFYTASKEIYKNMIPDLLKYSNDNPDHTIIVTGHSLGGALAPLIGNELILMGKNVTVVTYGSPKIGNKAFSRWMDDLWNTSYVSKTLFADHSSNQLPTNSYIRVTHKGDIVPYLPLSQMGYDHCGAEVYFDTEKLPMLSSNAYVKGKWIQAREEEEIGNDSEAPSDMAKVRSQGFRSESLKHRSYLFIMNACSGEKI